MSTALTDLPRGASPKGGAELRVRAAQTEMEKKMPGSTRVLMRVSMQAGSLECGERRARRRAFVGFTRLSSAPIMLVPPAGAQPAQTQDVAMLLLSVEQWRSILLASEPEEAAERILNKLDGYNMPRGTLARENDMKQLANALRAWRER